MYSHKNVGTCSSRVLFDIHDGVVTDCTFEGGCRGNLQGVSQLVKKLCDGVVRLDMAAQGTGVDSYNVSVAAGIILYEIQSQRAAQNA